MSDSFELPQNKPLINGKFRTADAIKSAIYQIFEKNEVKGKYTDGNGEGVHKLQDTLENNNIDYDLLDSSFEGHHEIKDSTLPTRKVYRFQLNVFDKTGKKIPLFLKVTCKFIGQTKTMNDDEYELSYSFF